MSPTPPWHPLLTGDDADLARRAVADIAAELTRHGPELVAGIHESRRSSLASGTAGIALFFAYLFEAFGEEPHADTALSLLDRSAELLASTATLPDLYSGFTGVAWTLEHLEGRFFEPDGEDGNADIDSALDTFLARRASAVEFDLIRGLAGFGVYTLERLPRSPAAGCLTRLVERLSETASRDERGVAWFSPPERLPDHQRKRYPEGHFNTGVAHGLPGVLPVLAAAAAAGVSTEGARELLDGAVSWLLAHRLEEGSASCFPYAVPAQEGAQGEACRLAWCYGDPGVATALLATARAVNEPAWEREALEVAVASAARPAESAGVRDTGLCHGSAGLGHLYNRLYQASSDERLAQAARLWYRRCLELGRDHRAQGRGVAGFPSWSPKEGTSDFDWQPEPGFLTGAAGVGLALLAAISEVEPEWDRVLAVSLRAR